jgi:hypothetical protein
MIEHISRPLRRVFARIFALQAAQKLKTLFGGDLGRALEDVSRAATRPPEEDEE